MENSREYQFGSAKRLVEPVDSRDSRGETSEVRRTQSLMGKPVSERRELFEDSKTRTLPGRKVASKRQIFENKSSAIARDIINKKEKTTTSRKPTHKLNDIKLDKSRVWGSTGNVSSISHEGMVSVGLANSRREISDNPGAPRKRIVRGQSVREMREVFEGPKTQLMRSQSVKFESEAVKTPKNGVEREAMTFRELRGIFEDPHPPIARLKSMKSIDYLHKTSGEEIMPGVSSKSEERRLDNRKRETSQWVRITPRENVPQTLRQLDELAISREEPVHNSEATTVQRLVSTIQSSRVSPNSVAASPARNVPNIIITDETRGGNLYQDLLDVSMSRNQAVEVLSDGAINQHRPVEDHGGHFYENVTDDLSDRASNYSFVDDFSSDDDDDIYERID